MKGWGMSGEMMFFLAVVVAIFGIYKYAKSETNDYSSVLRGQVDQQQQINDLKTKLSKVDDFQKAIDEFAKKVEGLDTEVSNYQEYNAAIRESVIELRDKLSNKQPTLNVRGPIQVEIQSRTPAAAPSKLTPEEVNMIRAYRANKAGEVPPVPKDAKSLLKKTKKQIEELSK